MCSIVGGVQVRLRLSTKAIKTLKNKVRSPLLRCVAFEEEATSLVLRPGFHPVRELNDRGEFLPYASRCWSGMQGTLPGKLSGDLRGGALFCL